MQTEKATNFYDMPHEAASLAGTTCVCGRPYGDAIHDVTVAAEQAASSTQTLITEKGS